MTVDTRAFSNEAVEDTRKRWSVYDLGNACSANGEPYFTGGTTTASEHKACPERSSPKKLTHASRRNTV